MRDPRQDIQKQINSSPSTTGRKLVRNPDEGGTGITWFTLFPSPPISAPCPRAKPLPGILSEWGPLIPIWEAKQGDGSKQPLLLLLLTPKQVLSLQRIGKETGWCGVGAGGEGSGSGELLWRLLSSLRSFSTGVGLKACLCAYHCTQTAFWVRLEQSHG